MTLSLWALVAIYLLVGVSVAVLLDAEPCPAPRARFRMALMWTLFWFPLIVGGAVVVAVVVVLFGGSRRS